MSFARECENFVQYFDKFSESEQMGFVELLLTKMLHHQHSHESSFLRPMLRRDFISLLPERCLDHVAENILSYLDAKSLCAAELVCKEWYQVISEGMLWKKLIERRVRTDSSWRGLMEQRGWIKYLFKPSPGEPHPDHMFYRRLYPKIIQEFENIENNWRCGRPTLKKINCHSENSEGAWCVEYDDHTIVSGLSDNTIKIWDRNTLECIQVLTGHTGPVVCLLYDDGVIISESTDSTVRVWDAETGELIDTLFPHHGDQFHLLINNAMMVLCFGDSFDDPSWTVWNIDSSEVHYRTVFSDGDEVYISVITSDGKYIYPSVDRRIVVLINSTGELVRSLQGHERHVLCVQHSDRLVVSGSMDKTIRLWDVESGACLRTLEGHKDFVTCIQFDNKRIVSGAKDGEIKVWDLAAALDPHAPAETLCLRTLVEHSGSIYTLQFDAFQIVSSAGDDTIVIWDFLNGTPPETTAMHICLTYIKNAFRHFFSFVEQQIYYF